MEAVFEQRKGSEGARRSREPRSGRSGAEPRKSPVFCGETAKNAPNMIKNRKRLYPGSTASNPLPAGAFAL
jgi:hypothetical protein